MIEVSPVNDQLGGRTQVDGRYRDSIPRRTMLPSWVAF
jgi:hypothetical protein